MSRRIHIGFGVLGLGIVLAAFMAIPGSADEPNRSGRPQAQNNVRILKPADPFLNLGRGLEANRAVLEESAAAVWGPGTRLDILMGTAAPQAAAEAKPAPVQQVEQIPTVQAVLDIFKGRIETVEEHGSYTED